LSLNVKAFYFEHNKLFIDEGAKGKEIYKNFHDGFSDITMAMALSFEHHMGILPLCGN